MKKFLFILLLNSNLFSQITEQDSSFLDKLNLTFQPQIEYFYLTHNSEILNNKPYLQKPIDGKISISKGLILGAGVGVMNESFNLLYSFRFSVPELASNSKLLFRDEMEAMNILEFYYQEHAITFQYNFYKFAGIGIEYKIHNHGFSAMPVKGLSFISMDLDIGNSLLLLYVPLNYSIKNIKFNAQIGLSLWGRNRDKDVGYYAQFLNFQNPALPDVPSMYVENDLPINGIPRSFYFNVGISYKVFDLIPLVLQYRFQNDWSANEYSESWNSLILKTGLGF